MNVLQLQEKGAKLTVRDGWAICPACMKMKLLKVTPETVVQNLPCKCKRCGQETIVNIDMRLSQCRTTTSA